MVCLRVVDKDSSVAGAMSLEQGRYREEADTIMKQVEEKNRENKTINLILEFAVGKVEKVIASMVCKPEYEILIPP